MTLKRTSAVRLGNLLLFGLVGGASGGLLYQTALILISGSSISVAIFALSYLLFTIPAGIFVGTVAALFASLTGRIVLGIKSHELRSILIGCAAFLGGTIAAEITAGPFYVGSPPLMPSIVIGIVAGISFGAYVLLRRRPREELHAT